MKKEKSNNVSGGIGFTGLLTIAFIVLKLCGVISWSWWLVLSPMWISVGVVVLVLLVILIVAVIKVARKRSKKGKRNED